MIFKPARVVALALLPALMASASIDFRSTQSGADRPSWGRPQSGSWGLSGFLVQNMNKITGSIPVSDPSASFDPIVGYGADNHQYLGYQVKGPKGTRLIYDRLVAQQVIHVLGGDTDEQTAPPVDQWEAPAAVKLILGGDLFVQDGNSLGGASPLSPPVPVPEPASAALLGAAALFLGMRRPRRTAE